MTLNLNTMAAVDALPEEVRPVVQALIEGRLLQLVIIAEYDDGTVGDCFPILSENANRYAMIGAIDVLKRDYMREQITSRIEYEPRDEY